MWFAGRRYLLNDHGYRGITDHGNEIHADPHFDNTKSCAGFQILNPTLHGFGR